MTDRITAISQESVQAFAQKNNLSLDDAEKMLLDVSRWDDLPEGYMEGEEKKWAGLLESLKHQ